MHGLGHGGSREFFSKKNKAKDLQFINQEEESWPFN
jgi:hypothetical protein